MRNVKGGEGVLYERRIFTGVRFIYAVINVCGCIRYIYCEQNMQSIPLLMLGIPWYISHILLTYRKKGVTSNINISGYANMRNSTELVA